MDLLDFREEVNARLQRIENKIDQMSNKTVSNASDIAWMKGAMKFGASFITAVIGSIITYLFNQGVK